MAVTFSGGGIAPQVSLALNNTYGTLSRSLYRLSTGLRINTAADDPAGMAVSQSFRAQIATLTQAQRNAEDAVSLLQTAEASLDEIDEALTSMKALAEAAGTGTYTAAQRLVMNSEFSSLAAEIDRLAAASSYNGTSLLNGNIAASSTWSTAGGWVEPNSGVRIQVDDGATRATDYYYLSIPDVRSSALFSNGNVAVSTQAAAQSALAVINTAIITKDNARGWVGALQNRLESTMDSLEGQVSALTAALNNITDADVAAEMTTYIRSLVLAQSGTAMMAQANLFPRLALSLLNFN